jgi:hypothetical protein
MLGVDIRGRVQGVAVAVARPAVQFTNWPFRPSHAEIWS